HDAPRPAGVGRVRIRQLRGERIVRQVAVYGEDTPMPYMVNGIGTTIIPARGYITWNKAYAVDAVQWFVVFLIPIIPYKCVHAFNWVGNQYLAVPIRWSLGMVFRSALRSWLEVFGLVAIMMVILAAIFWYNA